MQSLQDAAIDTLPTEASFPSRFGGDARPLASSIQAYGILHPPRIYLSGERASVLDGLERIRIAREAGHKSIPCYFYDETQLSHANAFLMCLELNRLSRHFNLVEKALLLKTAHQVFLDHAIPKAFWHAVEIPHNIRALQQFRDLLHLPAAVQRYVVNNAIPLPTALSFLRFAPAEIDRLAAQIFMLPLNQNKLAEVLSLLSDVSKAEEISALAVLDTILPELELEFSPVHKEQKLRRLLQQRRNPHYERKLSEFESRVKQLPLNDKTKVRPAPYFEDDYVEVTTRFYSQEDMDAFIESLKDASWRTVIGEEK